MSTENVVITEVGPERMVHVNGSGFFVSFLLTAGQARDLAMKLQQSAATEGSD